MNHVSRTERALDTKEMRTPLILFVSSDTERSREFETQFSSLGFHIETSKNGFDAIELTLTLAPSLILSDLNLTDMNGFQFCRCIKSDLVIRNVPFVLLGNPEEHKDSYWSYKAGLDAYLDKSLSVSQLEPHLRELLKIFSGVRLQEKKRNLSLGKQTDEPLEINRTRPKVGPTRFASLLEHALIEINLIKEFRELLPLAKEPDLLNPMLFSLISSVVDYDVAAIFYHEPTNRSLCKVYFHTPDHHPLLESDFDYLRTRFAIALQENLFYRNLDPAELEWEAISALKQAKPEEQVPPPFEATTSFFQLFEDDQDFLGSFAFYSADSKTYDNIFPVPSVLDELMSLLKFRYLNAKRDSQTILDGLTNLYNYSHFIEHLSRECKRSSRYELNLSLCLIDIDNFDQFNETHGYRSGDELLKLLTTYLHASYRNTDIIARVSGSNFAVILPETSLDNALIACERLRNKVDSMPMMAQGKKMPCTVSIGLVMYDYEQMKSEAALFRFAGEALNKAKREGRNRTSMLTL